MLLLLAFSIGAGPGDALRGNSRVVEFPFALSADSASEYSARFHAFSPGRVVASIVPADTSFRAGLRRLRLLLLRPDGGEAVRAEGGDPLRVEYPLGDAEVDRGIESNRTRWTVRVIHGEDAEGREFRGLLRITVPTVPRSLVDTQFTLMGSGNAQEISFRVPSPGRIRIDASWNTVPEGSGGVPLTMSLAHPGLARVYARRQNRSPLRIEHQVTEAELDAGRRWVVRIQDDSESKVKGRLQVIFDPAL